MNTASETTTNVNRNRMWVIDVVFSCLLLIFSAYKFSFVTTDVMRIIRIGSVALLLLIHFRALRRLPNLFWIVQYCVAIIVCTILAGAATINILYAVLQGLMILTFFVTFDDLRHKYGTIEVLKILFVILLVVCLLNDATVIGSRQNLSGTAYLIGNKFATGDLHVLVVAVYAIFLSKKSGYVLYNWGIYWLLVAWSVFILIKASAMTSLLGFLVSVLITVVLTNKAKGLLLNGWLFVAVLAAANIIYFGTGYLLENEFVQHFVRDILGRSLTLTGRTPIYDALNLIISERPYFGWGYGSDIVERVVGYGNAQNGIADLAVLYGAVGVVSFALFMIGTVRQKGGASPYALPLTGLLYSVILTSMAEITFGLSFFFRVALLASLFPDEPTDETTERAPDEASNLQVEGTSWSDSPAYKYGKLESKTSKHISIDRI